MPESHVSVSRKRRRPEQPSQFHDPLEPPSKRQKVRYLTGSQHPPEFWDRLSKIWLTKRALREFDRRNNQPSLSARRLTRSAVSQWREDLNIGHLTEGTAAVLKSSSRKLLGNIKAFAKHGGPDLSALKGYTRPVDPLEYMMSASKSKKNNRASAHASTSNPSAETKPKQSSPYDRDFQQNLTDHGVYPNEYEYPDGRIPPPPDNLEEINRRLSQNRPSLSPSHFPNTEFREFKRADAHAPKEAQVTKSVIPFIEGKIKDARCVSGNIPFTNLDHLTNGTLVPGNPDVYYGSRPEQLNRAVRDRLSGQIVPSTQHDLPVAPNFFLAVKGPDGSAAVAKRQATYDGALGARGIHSLQSYEQDQPTYDNKAYTITSSYQDGQLKMYTSHSGAPSTPGGRPEYYMTQIRQFPMVDTPNTFREGAAAYRNLRDWAKEQRDEAIQQANAKSAARSTEVLPVEVPVRRTSRRTSYSEQPQPKRQNVGGSSRIEESVPLPHNSASGAGRQHSEVWSWENGTFICRQGQTVTAEQRDFPADLWVYYYRGWRGQGGKRWKFWRSQTRDFTYK